MSETRKQARVLQTVTLVIEKVIDQNDLSAYDAATFEEAARNDAAWLKGADGQGDYLIMELDNVSSIEVDTTVFEEDA